MGIARFDNAIRRRGFHSHLFDHVLAPGHSNALVRNDNGSIFRTLTNKTLQKSLSGE